MAELLRGLTVPMPDDSVIDCVPADLVLPATPVDSIHAVLPFSGTVPAALPPSEVRALTRSRRRDLLGVAWVLCALAPSGRAAVLVPASFLTDTTQGHLQLRRTLVEEGRLHGVIGLAAGCYKPRSAAAILLLGHADSGDVWFCDVADAGMLQPTADASEPECLERWQARAGTERQRTRAETSFLVPRAEVAAPRFDLSIAAYRAVEPAVAAPIRRPHEILAELAGLEAEIFQGLRDLVGMLKT